MNSQRSLSEQNLRVVTPAVLGQDLAPEVVDDRLVGEESAVAFSASGGRASELKSRCCRKLAWFSACLLVLAGSSQVGTTAELPQVQGLVLHLDAAALGLDDGAPVGLWPDLSGSGNNAVQDDPSARPTFVAEGSPFGMPVVRFDGSSPLPHLQVLSIGPYFPPNTVFVVWKINAVAGDQQVLDGVFGDDRVRIGYQASPSRIFVWAGGDFPNLAKTMSVPFENLMMTSVVYDPAGGVLRVDGVIEQEGPTGDIPLSGYTIGRRAVTETQQLLGDVAEVIVYDRRLSESEIEEVEAYLDGKWLRNPDDTTPPTVPEDLTAYAGAAFVHLSWTPSTDDSGQVSYQVQRNGEIIAMGVSFANYVDRAVAPSTTYTYAVQAADSSRNLSDFSSSVEVTTKELVLTTGTVKAEFYTGIPGILVENLTSADKFPDRPDDIRVLPSFETPENWGDNYGVRVTGWFVPPQTGDYVFFLSSDDEGEFRLSTDSTPANLKWIAQEPEWHPFRDWIGTSDRRDPIYPENRSDIFFVPDLAAPDWPEIDPETFGALISLQAGQRYYFEGLMKEGTGGDHLGVTYKLKSEPDPASGTPSRLTGDVIESEGDPDLITPVITRQPQSRLVNLGQSVTLRVEVESTSQAPLFYQWFKEDLEIPGATGPTHAIPAFTESDEDAYRVIVMHAAGTLTSQSALLRLAGEYSLVTEGLVLRLDATALELEDGAPVAMWPDLSGSGNNAVQADPAAQPTFVAEGLPSGMPVVRFDGSSPFPHLMVESMGPFDPPNTVFVVFKINEVAGDQQVLDGLTGDTRVRIGYQQNPGRLFAWSGGGFPNLEKSMPVPFENLLMAAVVYDPAGGLLRVDGVLEHEAPTGDIPLSGYTIGRRAETESQQLMGDIAEVIVYDRRLSETELQEVEGYLLVKWFAFEEEPSPLTLTATVLAGHLMVAWPASVEGAALEQTDSLSGPITWTPVTTPVVEQNGMHTVTLDLSGQQRFLRLSR